MRRSIFAAAAALAASVPGDPIARSQSDTAIKLVVSFALGAATDQTTVVRSHSGASESTSEPDLRERLHVRGITAQSESPAQQHDHVVKVTPRWVAGATTEKISAD